jgi:glycyl-tRNA synthetase beta chain
MEFLLEILTEELPASHVRTALEQLGAKFREAISSAGLPLDRLRTLGTCRRLIVVADMAPGEEDRVELITGPPKSAAYLPDGSFSPAARGFARARGIDPEALETIQTPKGEYIGVRQSRKGRTAREILPGLIPGIITSISFPKTMRWPASSFKFSRPVTNLLCLLGGEILSFSLDGLVSGDTTFGHPISSPEGFRPRDFSDYTDGLRARGVIVDPEERKAAILAQIGERLAPLDARIYPDDELVERLAFNVEHPFVILGSFPEKYLELPIEVLATAMREGQMLFSVVKDKKQIPYFLGVADVRSDPKSLIRMGNERVLKARLEDARFFWQHDTEKSLSSRCAGLKSVVFQEKLGTYDDKAQRLKKLVGYLCDRAGALKIKGETVEAAGLCKTDLLTDMVKEFPALQGKVGGLYARHEGYSAAVHQAIYEQYLPAGLDDDSPGSLSGGLLALADKIDSVVGASGIGIQVSGSSDPFGVRRNAHGVLKIILDKKLDLSFPHLVDKAIAAYGDKLIRPAAEIKAQVLDFFAGRLRFVLEKRGFRYDLINAAIGPGIENIHYVLLRVKAVDALKASPQFEPFILMAKRVNNILKEAGPARVNPDLFVEKEERDLSSTLAIIRENVEPMIDKGDFARAQTMIFKIQPSLNTFFDKVLVMAEDKKVRQNRLGLLQSIRKLLVRVADYSQVVVEGERTGKTGNSR